MKRILKLTGGILFAGLLLAQVVRPDLNHGEAEGPDSLERTHEVPPAVRTTLVQACYDCHSNRTAYPWYGYVQPVAWWTERHVKEGKAELNFSEFGTYSTRQAVRKLEEVMDEVELGTMPLESYRWLHHEARLSPTQVEQVVKWAENLAEQIDAQ